MFEKYREWIENASEHAVIGENALLLLGDSFDVLKDTALAADSVICDPPYDFDSDGGAKIFGRETKNYFHDMRERGLSDGFDMRILECAARAPSMIVFFHNDQVMDIVGTLTVGRPAPYERYALCGWKKTNPMPVANKHYVPDLELYVHAWRPPAHPYGKIEEKHRIALAPVGKSEEEHPTVKPQAIMRKCVLNASRPGDIILDPFAGTSSTGVAALALGRRFIGIERERDFFEISRKRLENCAGVWRETDEGQATLFGGDSK